jgi:hypothetical protein
VKTANWNQPSFSASLWFRRRCGFVAPAIFRMLLEQIRMRIKQPFKIKNDTFKCFKDIVSPVYNWQKWYGWISLG